MVHQVPGLQATLEHAFALLLQGAGDAANPWGTLTLATAGPGGPSQRTVVFRRFLPEIRELECHTDSRSSKLAELLASPAVSLQGWDAARRIQLRLTGLASVRDGAATRAIWQALPPRTQATYAVNQPPGSPIEAPEAAQRTQDKAAAQAVFRAIAVHIATLEYLHLAAPQHRRARFAWDQTGTQDGGPAATWVVP